MRSTAMVHQSTTALSDLPLPGESDVPCKPLHRPQTILFMVDQLTELGGGERMLFQLARELSRHDYRVSIITFRGNLNPLAYTLFPDITVFHLSSCFSVGAARVASQIRAYIRSRNVTVVHTYFETADIYGALVARLSGVRRIVSSRRDLGILRSRKHFIAYRLMAPLYRTVLAVSDSVRQWHADHDHLDGNRVKTIHNGLDMNDPLDENSADVRARWGIPPDVPVILTIANVNPWKGVDVFVDCARKLHAVHPEAVFVVAGDWSDGPLVASLQNQVRDWGINNSVAFLGRVDDVGPLLRASNVFALLSRSEGFPNVIVEAMAAHLPVVATRVGGTSEIVVDGVTGFLVPVGDIEQPVSRIDELLRDQALRTQMGRVGRERVEQNFSLTQMVRKHMEVYDALA